MKSHKSRSVGKNVMINSVSYAYCIYVCCRRSDIVFVFTSQANAERSERDSEWKNQRLKY